MTTETPLITVIVPTFNRRRLLAEALESIASQTWPNVEVIVVDDGSSDETFEFLKEEFPSVTVHRQENKGQAAARNAGLKYARGQYICSLDSDDIWNPDFLERSVWAIEALNADFVFSNWIAKNKSGESLFSYFEKDNYWRKYKTSEYNGWHLLSPQQARELYLEVCPSPSSALLFRADRIQQGWTEDLNIADDWCLLLDQVLSKPCRVAFTMDRLWTKRTQDDNICDERNPTDVIFELNICDSELMVRRHRSLLTAKERTHLQRRYSRAAVDQFFRSLSGQQRRRCVTLAGYAWRGSFDAFRTDPFMFVRKLAKITYLATARDIEAASELRTT